MEFVTEATLVEHDRDPREEILDELRTPLDFLSMIQVGGEDVLIARYERTGKTLGGLHLPSQTEVEGLAGKTKSVANEASCTGLILKMGPLAYRTEKTRRWFADSDHEGDPPKVGEWVFIDPGCGRRLIIGKRVCYLMLAQWVFLKLGRPDIVQ